MKILIFGASGMVGQGVLRECLLDKDVEKVVSLGRTPVDIEDPKLQNLKHADLYEYKSIEKELTGFDACFFCLGISVSGLNEDQYRHVTYDLTLTAAETLARLNPRMVFTYISGASTDSSEKGRVMWARVKGQVENALLRLPFKGAYMFRPGLIVPVNGEVSKTKLYRLIYTILNPILKPLVKMAPGMFVTTSSLGRAMLKVAKVGFPKKILEVNDILKLK